MMVMMLNEWDAAEAARVREWTYREAYGRKMHVTLLDGSEQWVGMGTPLASELYRVGRSADEREHRGEPPPVAECVDCGITVSTEGVCEECAPWRGPTD